MKTSVKLLAIFGVAAIAAGCNTVRGFGEDLQAAGGMIATGGKKDDKKGTPAAAAAPAPAPAAVAPAPAPAPAAAPAPAPQQPTRR
jgi:predicted small secreted protein